MYFLQDSDNQIFSCSGGRSGFFNDDYFVMEKHLYNSMTISWPHILHVPGKHYPFLKKMARQLENKCENATDYTSFSDSSDLYQTSYVMRSIWENFEYLRLFMIIVITLIIFFILQFWS
jgi:hypothetical protein